MHAGRSKRPKTIVLTSAKDTKLTCFILLQNIFFCNKQPSLTADVNTIMNLPWYPRKIAHFSLILSPSRLKISMVKTQWPGQQKTSQWRHQFSPEIGFKGNLWQLNFDLFGFRRKYFLYESPEKFCQPFLNWQRLIVSIYLPLHI
jgi:hypothetical protein